MTVEQVLNLLETRVAPVRVSDDFCAKYKMYDNSGIIINCGNTVSGALFSLDLSEAAVDEAIRLGYNLIVTHHPAIYGGISRFDLTNCAQSRAIAKCIKNGISVVSMHLNFDAAPKGIDYYLMRGLGGENANVLAQVDGGGYGRVFEICPRTMPQLTQDIQKNFATNRILIHGNFAGKVSKIACFCGAGLDDNAVAFAKQNGANAVVSSDLSHHRISELVESGITVIQLTHYCAESYGFKRIYNEIKTGLQVETSFFSDERFV